MCVGDVRRGNFGGMSLLLNILKDVPEVTVSVSALSRPSPTDDTPNSKPLMWLSHFPSDVEVRYFLSFTFS